MVKRHQVLVTVDVAESSDPDGPPSTGVRDLLETIRDFRHPDVSVRGLASLQVDPPGTHGQAIFSSIDSSPEGIYLNVFIDASTEASE